MMANCQRNLTDGHAYQNFQNTSDDHGNLVELVNAKVDELFHLIGKLPRSVRPAALAKIKEKLNHAFDKNLNSGSTSEEPNEKEHSQAEAAVSSSNSPCSEDVNDASVSYECPSPRDQCSNDSNPSTPIAVSSLNKSDDGTELAFTKELLASSIKQEIGSSEKLLEDEHRADDDAEEARNLNEDVERSLDGLYLTNPEQLSPECILTLQEEKDHKGNSDFQCDICGKYFKRKGGLACHLRRHSGIKPFKCPSCDYSSVARVDIMRHISSVHTKERNYVCEFCGKRYPTDLGLNLHIKTVHQRMFNVKCPLCEFVTYSNSKLKKHHQVRHTDEEKLECPVCHVHVKQKGVLQVHMRTHTGERPYPCQTCSKSFRSNSQLRAHERIHKKGQFVCSVCEQIFVQKAHLQRHMLVHTGEKPFACTACTYKCSIKGNLKKHMKLVHGITNVSEKQASVISEPTEPDEASKRGITVAEEILKKASEKLGVKVTIEDLQKQAKKKDEMPSLSVDTSNSNFKNDITSTPTTAMQKVISEHTARLPNIQAVGSLNLLSVEQGSRLASDISHAGISAEQDILSNAVKLLTSASSETDDDSVLSVTMMSYTNDSLSS